MPSGDGGGSDRSFVRSYGDRRQLAKKWRYRGHGPYFRSGKTR